MPEPIVQIEHLNHSYGERPALSDLSLSVQRGEIFGFLGPNGSGKTTLFRILSTLLPVRSGSVKILGMDLTTQREEIRRQIGVVFQSPSLDKQLTAEENLRHQGHLYGLSGAELERRIDEMLARVGLSERPREYVSTFSGGMRRRVELAKGLLHRPHLLLLDEPSTGLDPGARIDLWKYLREIRDKDGVTVMVTTHLMDEAEHCNRLAIMDCGKLIACDSPAALKDQIGGDVITLTASDPGALRNAIREKFALDSVAVDNALRIERDRGHEFIPQLVEAFPGLIRSVSLGKPTLDDVFVHVTGRRFENKA
jgi:ABC-2 type transport system ATP-binding protein